MAGRGTAAVAGTWSCLPKEIVMSILAQLPLVEFARVMGVCKSWYALAQDPQFLRLQRPYKTAGFALFLTDGKLSHMLYLDTASSSTWRQIPLWFLPGNLYSGLKLLASCGGLVLLGTPGRELLLINPITKRWLKLPPRKLVEEPFYVTLAVDATGFLVVVADSELRGSRATTEVYHSVTGMWGSFTRSSKAGRWKRVVAAMPTPWTDGCVPVSCKPVYCNGAFYHLVWDPQSVVAEFSPSTMTWRSVTGPTAIPPGNPWGLMERSGKVVLVLDAGTCGELVLSLWELQLSTLSWRLLGSVPTPSRPEFRVSRCSQFALGGGCLLVAFLVHGGDVTTLAGTYHDSQQQFMIFDISSMEWRAMPHLPATRISPPNGRSSCLFDFGASLCLLSH